MLRASLSCIGKPGIAIPTLPSAFSGEYEKPFWELLRSKSVYASSLRVTGVRERLGGAGFADMTLKGAGRSLLDLLEMPDVDVCKDGRRGWPSWVVTGAWGTEDTTCCTDEVAAENKVFLALLNMEVTIA